MSHRISRIGSAALGLAAAIGSLAFLAGPAHAEGDQDCNDNTYALCLYFNSNEKGARTDAVGSVWNYSMNLGGTCSSQGCSPYMFWYTERGSNGYGHGVKNAAASGCLDGAFPGFDIYYNSGHTGPSDSFKMWECRQLVNTYNNNASQQPY